MERADGKTGVPRETHTLPGRLDEDVVPVDLRPRLGHVTLHHTNSSLFWHYLLSHRTGVVEQETTHEGLIACATISEM